MAEIKDEEMLTDLLKGRLEPYSPEGLAERIVEYALAQEQEVPRWRREVAALFIMVRPAYALAAMLVLGFILGLESEPLLSFMQEDWGSYLDINPIGSEDWS